MTVFNPYEFKPADVRADLNTLLKRGSCVFEPKLDGARQVLSFINRTAYMTGRRRSIKTGKMLNKITHVPHLSDWLYQFNHITDHEFGVVFDGEIVTSKAYSNSNAVTSILNSKPERAIELQRIRGKLQFVIFDIVMYLKPNGTHVDLKERDYIERRAILEDLVRKYPGMFSDTHVSLIPMWHVPNTDYESVYLYAREKGFEGVVAKLINGKYHRNSCAKIKAEETFDMIITGYIPSESLTYAGNGIAALELGLYDGGFLVRGCCKCAGMTEEWRYEFYHDYELMEDGYESKYIGKVVEVTGQEMFDTGAIRHPRFVCIREDKNAQDCVFPTR